MTVFFLLVSYKGTIDKANADLAGRKQQVFGIEFKKYSNKLKFWRDKWRNNLDFWRNKCYYVFIT